MLIYCSSEILCNCCVPIKMSQTLFSPERKKCRNSCLICSENIKRSPNTSAFGAVDWATFMKDGKTVIYHYQIKVTLTKK